MALAENLETAIMLWQDELPLNKVYLRPTESSIGYKSKGDKWFFESLAQKSKLEICVSPFGYDDYTAIRSKPLPNELSEKGVLAAIPIQATADGWLVLGRKTRPESYDFLGTGLVEKAYDETAEFMHSDSLRRNLIREMLEETSYTKWPDLNKARVIGVVTDKASSAVNIVVYVPLDMNKSDIRKNERDDEHDLALFLPNDLEKLSGIVANNPFNLQQLLGQDKPIYLRPSARDAIAVYISHLSKKHSEVIKQD